jgi:hypothetical protein
MPITDLARCTTRHQIEEAIAKPIAYTLVQPQTKTTQLLTAIVQGRWADARSGLTREKRNRDDRAVAAAFCQHHGIELVWQFRDPVSGFELAVFRWEGRSYIVAIGSNDPTDWKHNLTRHSVGLDAYIANKSAVREAIVFASFYHPAPSEIIVMGHSLGGSIAQYIAVDYGKINTCKTYQSAAVPPAFVARSTRRPELSATHYLHPSDPVYPLSKRRCDGGLILGTVAMHGYQVHGFDRIKAHSLMLSLLPTTG